MRCKGCEGRGQDWDEVWETVREGRTRRDEVDGVIKGVRG